jgi:16S rRNA (adenine1518-N6/adenine1519-N6)-dimethyltransferase
VPRRRHGQNFLHDGRIARRIVAAAEVGPGSHVLEIGPGLGALTRPLLETGARVTSIEIDPRVADFLEEELGGREGFTLVRGDALEADLDAVAPGARVLVANLPYSITGPVLSLLIGDAGRFERAVLMVQKEVAVRLTASAGGRALGAPAVLLRLAWSVERLFDVGSGAFVPAPEVTSRVVRFVRRAGPPEASLRETINRAYRQRRKMIRKTLAGDAFGEEALSLALAAIGRPDTARPEDLEPEDWPKLLREARAAA